jgi:hypothetical protein
VRAVKIIDKLLGIDKGKNNTPETKIKRVIPKTTQQSIAYRMAYEDGIIETVMEHLQKLLME